MSLSRVTPAERLEEATNFALHQAGWSQLLVDAQIDELRQICAEHSTDEIESRIRQFGRVFNSGAKVTRNDQARSYLTEAILREELEARRLTWTFGI